MNLLRRWLFLTSWSILTIFWSIIILLMIILPFHWRHLIATAWADMTMWLLKIICGIDYQINNQENIPAHPVILVSNHQSTWETIFMPILIRKQVWVIKKELLYLPFFGWSMALLGAIGINRSQGRKSMNKIFKISRLRLNKGYSIVIFPEGHRFPSEQPVHFKSGAARLAKNLNANILPVAHNAGLHWPPKGGFRPGTISITIGEVIKSDQLTATALTQQAENWVEKQRQILTSSAGTIHD